MKIKNIDEEYRLKNHATDEVESVWYTYPMTQEEVDEHHLRIEQLTEALKTNDSSLLLQSIQVAMGQDAKVTEGRPWTTRLGVIKVMYSPIFELAKKDSKTGVPIPESSDVTAQMQSIGLAFTRAPKHGYVEISAKDLELIQRKAYELPLHPRVKSLLDERLWETEGTKNKHLVTFGEGKPSLELVEDPPGE